MTPCTGDCLFVVDALTIAGLACVFFAGFYFGSLHMYKPEENGKIDT